MKKITFLLSGLLLFFSAQQLSSQTVFDWETAADNGSSITQTVNGITATVTNSSTNIDLVNGGGFAGSSGVVVYNPSPNQDSSITVSFSQAVDLKSIFALDADASGGSTWTFTPNGGSNSPVSEPIAANSGKTVDLNWTNINSVTITSSQGNESFALDNVTLALPCSPPDVPTLTATSTTVCDGTFATLNISGDLNDATQWRIYSGSCGGSNLGSTSGSTFTVSPNAPNTTYYVRGEGGCVTPGTCASITINVLPQEDPSFSYSAAAYCADDSDPTPNVTGVNGGTFSSTAGLSIDSSTGAVDLSASTPATYTVTYTTPGTCSNSSNVSLTVNALDNASFSYSEAAYCPDDSDPTPTVTGLTGGTFSSTAGLSINASTGAIDVSASTPGNYTVTYTTSGTCPNSSNVSLTINALDDASFSYSAAAYCADDSDPTPTVTGLTGGTFSSTAGLSINASTGAIDLSASTPSTYTVTYTTSGTCPNSSNVSLTINALDDASFSYSEAAYCADDSDPTPNVTGVNGGTFSSTAGLSINASTGAIDVSASTPGNYTVTYTTSGTCPNSSNVSLTINALDDASFSYSEAAYCADDSDPTPTVTGVNGGTFSSTAGLSINASTGAIDLSASTPATYTVTYTTSGTCPNSSNVSLTINTLDDASFSYSAAVYCADDSDPTPTVTGLTGGTFSSTAGLSINASTGAIDLSASTPGNYTVTYTTSGTCPNSSNASINVANLSASAAAINVSCNGGDDGAVNLTVTGGTAPYTFDWSNGATTEDITGLEAATYSVTVTDANLCTATASATVTEPVTLTASATVDANVSCNGGENGTATASGTGGTTPYTYLWDDTDAQTTATATGLAAGTYTVTITDDNGCDDTASVTINEPATLTASAMVDANVSCNAGENGQATASAVGGTSPYTYLWDDTDAQTTATATGLPAGTYTVTITDDNGCTDTASVTITEPIALTASATVDDNVSCNAGNDGTATASGTGGTPPYTYLWDDTDAQTTATAVGLAAGTYTVTITDDNGCTDTASVTITEPIALTASATVDNNVSCNGGGNGNITIDLNGGTSPFEYVINGTTYSNFPDPTLAISGLQAGTYPINVTDANGCTATTSVTITEPVTLTASATVDANVSCNGGENGTATASGTGGTPPYTYLWDDIDAQTTATATGLAAGTYTVTITDDNGCDDTASVTINEPATLTASAMVDANVSCNAGNDGQATASAVGGTSPYTYLWDDADIQTTATATGLAAGTYTVTITDDNGCTDTASVTINEPVTLTASATVDDNVSCNAGNDGTATGSGTGGTPPYTYLWDDTDMQTTATAIGLAAGTYTVTITDDNGCTDTASVTITEPVALTASATVNDNVSCNGGGNGNITIELTGGTSPFEYVINGTTYSNFPDPTLAISGLQAGTYPINVTDANGCTATTSVTITEPVTLTASATVDANVSCNAGENGTATASGTGGTPPYTYLWDDTDAQTTATATGLAAGTYTVTITDDNGCTDTASVTINEPATLTAFAMVDANVSCNAGNDGQATASAVGGTSPYTYLWDDADMQTTATATGLAAGTYTVTITDDNGCTDTASVTINEPVTLTASATVDDNVSCNAGNDGTATASGTGGTPPYTYLWDDTDMQTTATAVGLAAGTYTVTITDDNGCTDTASVTITEPVALTASATVDDNVSCNGGGNGNITIELTGGTSPFEYVINGTTYSNFPDPTLAISGLQAGTYPINVTDANGCTDTTSVTITEPAALSASAIVDANVNCNGGENGLATVAAVGGTAPYTYLWDDNDAQTTATATGLAAGTYNVTVTDDNGCTDSASVTITEPVTLTASAMVDTNVSCNAGNDGTATASGTGGTPPYTYLWDDTDAQTTATATGLTAGTYTVTITDANLCTATASATINEPVTLTASAIVDANASCNAGENGQATVSAVGGTAPYTYLWDDTDAQTTATATGLAAGTYNVTVTDNNGCTDTASVTITEPAALTASAIVDTNVNCNGGTNGQATVAAVGGTAPYTYLWDDNDAQTTATATGLAAGTYTVTITDDNGCTDTASVTITEPVTLTASTTVDANVSCNGESNGQATVSAVGGTAPYTYLWDDNDAQTTATATGLAAGTYNVTITDANLCTTTASATINEPVTLTGAAIVDANVSCNGSANGQATVAAVGGTAPYTYLWDDNDAQTTATAIGLAAGTYNVTITDANGCTATASATITEPTAIVIDAIVTANASCNGANNGAASITITGGAAPYEFDFDNSTYADVTDNETVAIGGLLAGTYEVTVTDANNCPAIASVTITEPTTLLAETSVDTDLSCIDATDGSATVTVAGGVAPYTYLWDDADAQTTATATGLVAGTYTVTVTDDNGCTTTASVDIVVADDEAPVVVCQDITVSLDENGNASILAEDIDNGSTDNCTIASFEVDIDTFDCTMIGMNNVTLTVTDESGNSATCSSVVTVEDNEMPMVSCQALFINLDENGQASIVPEDIVTASSDNCAVETLSLDIDTFSCEDAGTEVEVTVFAQDASGNIASCSALVSVNDVTAPVIECMEEMEVVGNTGDNFYSLANFVANGDVSATDSCDGEVTTIVQTPPAGTLLQEGQHEILFVAEDQYGNSSICSTIITVTLDLKVDAPRLNLGKVKLYPNPADSYITVENPQSIALDKMVIYDLNGRKVMDMDLVNYSQGQHIDISKLEAAQYFAMIRSKANGTVVKRFIKE